MQIINIHIDTKWNFRFSNTACSFDQSPHTNMINSLPWSHIQLSRLLSENPTPSTSGFIKASVAEACLGVRDQKTPISHSEQDWNV